MDNVKTLDEFKVITGANGKFLVGLVIRSVESLFKEKLRKAH
ncbi:hypothetical protein [Dulcicalothrix desertica]|nr:hypothetical protein [Dulcicalothrix desertica]